MLLVLGKLLQLGLGLSFLVLDDFLGDLCGLLHLGCCLGADDLFLVLILGILVELSLPLELLSFVLPFLLNGVLLIVSRFLVSFSDAGFLFDGRLLRALETVLYGLLALVIHLSHGMRFVNFGRVNVAETILVGEIF